MKTILYWTPRILGLLFAAFLALFALEVPGEGRDIWGTTLAIAAHLLPSALVLGALALAWRREWLGALLFFGLGAWYTFETLHHPSWILTIAGPSLLLSALFLLNSSCLKRAPCAAPR